jgi:hypothetical protein
MVFSLDKVFSFRVATVATLPSALFDERVLFRSVQVGCSRFSRCCHLIIDLFPSHDGVGQAINAVTGTRLWAFAFPS